MNKINHKANVYGEGNVAWTIFKLSIPAMILALGEAMYQVIDSLLSAQFVSYGGGYTAATLAAATTPIIIILFAFVQLASVGYGIKLSKALGKNNEDDVNKVIKSSLVIFGIVSLLTILFSLFFAYPIFHSVYGYIPDDEIRNKMIWDGTSYIFISSIVIVLIMLRNLISITLRSEGHVRAVAYLPLLAIPINIGFDIIFMHPNILGLGLIGAGFASLIAESVAIIIVFLVVFHHKRKKSTHIKLSIFKYKINWKIVGGLLLLGLTPFILQILEGLINEMATLLMAKSIPEYIAQDPTIYGDWLGWRGTTYSPTWLVLTAGVTISSVGATLVGYNIGTKDAKRVKDGIIWSIILFILVTLVMAIILSLLVNQIFWLYNLETGESEKNVMIKLFVMWLFISIIVDLIYQYNGLLNTMKKTKQALIITLINSLCIFIPSIIASFLIFRGTEKFYLVTMYYPIYAVLQTLIIGSLFVYWVRKWLKEKESKWFLVKE